MCDLDCISLDRVGVCEREREKKRERESVCVCVIIIRVTRRTNALALLGQLVKLIFPKLDSPSE